MSANELEREIRKSPTMNERFLLGLLDEARGKIDAALGLHVGMHPCPLGGGDSLVYDDGQICPTTDALGGS